MAIPDYKLSTVLCGHSLDVRCVASSKEFCILSASRDHTAKLWHPEGVKDYVNIVTYKGHTNFVSSVCWLPPCESFPEGLVVTGSNDNTILGYNLQDGAVVVTLEGHENAVCFVSPGREPGVLLSSSGDSTAKVWNVNSLTIPPVTLKGHQAAVWSVIELCNGTLATASTDKTIALWKKDGTQITVLQGHTDCVRGLTVASQDTFLSCSNDASIRVWTNGGQCLNTYYGHSNHIYSISMNQSVGKNCFATCGEDGCVRMWMNGDCVRSIGVPAQSVWSVACLTNGDIVTGSSDGVVRVFTCDPARFADEVTLKQYEEDMEKMVADSTQKIGEYKLTEIPGCEVLMEPGVTDGQSILVRRGTNVKYYSWSVAEQNWNEIGDVISTDQLTEENTMNQGQQYDEEFSIDIKYVTATDPLELPINKTEDPLAAEQVSTSSNNAFADPLTGESRYLPGCEVTSREPSPVAPDPITGSGASTDKPLISHDSHLRVYEGNLRLIFDKLKEFNSKLGDDLSPLTDDQLKNIAATSLLLNMSVSQQKNNVDLAQCMVQVLNNTTDKEAHFRSAPVPCMVEELPSTEQLERPKTTRKRKYSPSPSASACSRTLQSSTPSPIELADSSSRYSPDLGKGQLSPTTGFWKASEADKSLGLSTVLLLPLDKVEVKQDSEVSSPAASVGSSTLGSVPNTPNRSSRQKLTLSPPATLSPTASKSLFRRGLRRRGGAGRGRGKGVGGERPSIQQTSSPVSYMVAELPLTEQLEKPKTRRKIKFEIKNEVDVVQDSEAFLPASYKTVPMALPSSSSAPQQPHSPAAALTGARLKSTLWDVMIQNETDGSEDEAEPQGHLSNMINYGSEDEADDGEEEGYTFIPRTERIFLDIEAEEDDEDDLAQDQFDFDWRALGALDPASRREVFQSESTGPTAVFGSPYEAFTAIWTPEFMQKIADETNRYAQEKAMTSMQQGNLGPNSRINWWKDTDVDELYVYFALVLLTGLNGRSDITEFWSRDSLLYSPVFGMHMSKDRFLLLSSCLHFCDNSTIDPTLLPVTKAKLVKIQPVVDHLNDRFQRLYNLHQNIALDESLTEFKGLLSIKQVIKSKAASAGIKTFEICESSTGYLWRFKVYAGRDDAAQPVAGYIERLVLELLRGLENKGHTVWMDNFYNGPRLARVMKRQGFDCAGTLRTNRQGVPPQIKNLQKSQMTIGEVHAFTSGDVDIVCFRDKNRVAMISTFHGAGVNTVDGVTKPIVIRDYNVCMGGVDKKDQMLSTYPIERKRTRIWYKKLFRRLLNVSVLNSFILYRGNAQWKVGLNRQHREYRKQLIRELLRTHQKRSVEPEMPPQPNVVVFPSLVQKHKPVRYGFRSDRRNTYQTFVCKVCSKRQPTKCAECQIPLCSIDCHWLFHSAEYQRNLERSHLGTSRC